MNYRRKNRQCLCKCCNGAFDPNSRCTNIFRRRVIWVPSTIIDVNTIGF